MIQFGKGKTLLQLIDRKQFDELCCKWEMDKRIRSFSTWEHTCAHIMAFVMRLESLREIEAVLLIPRSTFSDANASREAGFFHELCTMVLKQIQGNIHSRKVKRAIKEVLAMDASECKVHGSLCDLPRWLQKKSKGKRVASLKFHAVWNIDNEWIEDFRVTPGNTIDTIVAKQFTIRAGCIYVFDRAYNDLTFWWEIFEARSHFVSRLKDCSKRKKHREKILRKNKGKDGVLWQGEWGPTQRWRHPTVPKDVTFRHIIYRDSETKKVFDFITSDRESTAQEIADLYKRRWAVELLFRWLKGHLHVRYFAAKNPNAVKIQMAIAVLVQLLTQLYRVMNRYQGTLWDCLREARISLTLSGLTASEFPDGLRWNAWPAAESTG